MVEGYLADLGADRESDSDMVVEAGLIIDLAEIAVKLTMHALEAAEAFDNTRALPAEQLPVHFEETEGGGVQEEIDDLGLPEVLLAGEGKWIDAEQRFLVRRPDMALELGDQTRAPGPGLLELGEALIQQLFMDSGAHGRSPELFQHITRRPPARFSPSLRGEHDRAVDTQPRDVPTA